MKHCSQFYLLLLNLTSATSVFCPEGHFSIGSNQCHAWLNCNDIRDLTLGPLVGYGAVKKVYKSFWNEIPVAVVFVNNPLYTQDFNHGLELLMKLKPSKYLLEFIGMCKKSSVYLTKFYELGPLTNFENFLPANHYKNFLTRFKLCLNYIEIINYIHSFQPPFVMCDSNTLDKTLEQYLLSDFDTIILSDIDALTEVSAGIICGHKEIMGTFAAPEQLWPYSGKYVHEKMPLYDEKSDKWKIPLVCKHLLGDSNLAINARYQLLNINKKCLNHNPSQRPNSTEILKQYKKVYNNFLQKDEL